MAIQDRIFRITRIVKRLKRGPASYSEINSYLMYQCEIHDFVHEFSKRNFMRDKALILTVFNIEILYCASDKKCFINPDDLENMPPEGSNALHYFI